MAFMSTSILFQSLESKAIDGSADFNRIRWFQLADQDVWMMNQSHHGISAEKEKWDRLAIVVDKTTTPPTAKFYQLKSGPLVWSEDIIQQRVPYKVSCFICHANGASARK